MPQTTTLTCQGGMVLCITVTHKHRLSRSSSSLVNFLTLSINQSQVSFSRKTTLAKRSKPPASFSNTCILIFKSRYTWHQSSFSCPLQRILYPQLRFYDIYIQHHVCYIRFRLSNLYEDSTFVRNCSTTSCCKHCVHKETFEMEKTGKNILVFHKQKISI